MSRRFVIRIIGSFSVLFQTIEKFGTFSSFLIIEPIRIKETFAKVTLVCYFPTIRLKQKTVTTLVQRCLTRDYYH